MCVASKAEWLLPRRPFNSVIQINFSYRSHMNGWWRRSWLMNRSMQNWEFCCYIDELSAINEYFGNIQKVNDAITLVSEVPWLQMFIVILIDQSDDYFLQHSGGNTENKSLKLVDVKNDSDNYYPNWFQLFISSLISVIISISVIFSIKGALMTALSVL